VRLLPARVFCAWTASTSRHATLMPNDHRCPAKRFTARRMSMTESMSSRFSRR
jgi:hypothetical protein